LIVSLRGGRRVCPSASGHDASGGRKAGWEREENHHDVKDGGKDSGQKLMDVLHNGVTGSYNTLSVLLVIEIATIFRYIRAYLSRGLLLMLAISDTAPEAVYAAVAKEPTDDRCNALLVLNTSCHHEHPASDAFPQ
jgi:hypothetical protein